MSLLFGVFLAEVVYRCELADGSTEYRGLPCPNGVAVDLYAPARPAAPADGLSEAEVRALARLQRRLASHAVDAKRQRSAQQRRRVSRAAERRKRCKGAVSRIGALRVKKRRGYPAKAAAGLDAEQARLESIIDADC